MACLSSDERGEIFGVITGIQDPIDSVLLITSKAGARRANHYHNHTGHYCVLTKGSMHYYERPVGSTEKPTCKYVRPGQVVWTGAMQEHLMVFDEDSEMWCFSTGNRAQGNYEADLVRLNEPLDKHVLLEDNTL